MNTPYKYDGLYVTQEQLAAITADLQKRFKQELLGIVEGEPYLPTQEQEQQ